jgi:hypothetical protein
VNEFVKDFYQTEGPLGFPMLDRQARALEQLLKALPQSEEFQYRKLTLAKAPTELNPGERSDVSWISTESPDRGREVVIARGVNDSQFAQNPVVTLQHAYWMPPVGKSLWRKRVKDGDTVGIKAKTRYPDKPESWGDDPWPADKTFALVQAGVLNGKSVGILPTRLHMPDSKECMKNEWDPDQVRLVIDECILLEYACVFLPMNQDALVEAVSKGSVDIPLDLQKAMGIDPAIFKAPEPAPPLVSPGMVKSFTMLSEIEAAVQSAFKGINFEEITRKAVEEVFNRRQGRV